MSGLFTLFIFVVLITIAALVFGGWVVFSIFGMLFRTVAWLLGADTSPRHAALTANATETQRCGRQGCRAMNPSSAKFCRRCGFQLASQRVAVHRRAAVL